MLRRDQIIDLAIKRFFLAMNNHDMASVLGTFAETCVMRIPSSGFTYDGMAALETHFVDFLETFSTIRFSDFVTTVDVDQQRIAVRFHVTLIDDKGQEDQMQNANFFSVDESGLFGEIVICTSAPVRKGFTAGSA